MMRERRSDPGDQLRLALLQRLESLQRSGVRQLTRPPAPVRPAAIRPSNPALPEPALPEPALPEPALPEPALPEPARPEPARPEPARLRTALPPKVAAPPGPHGKPVTVAPPTTSISSAAPQQSPTVVEPTWESLSREVTQCARCPELVAQRTQTVFGVGPPRPRVCFLGEAPGEDEDRQGEPFVGRAGQLLNKIIEACKWQRQDVYILNVLKCRPPQNRAPLPEEVANCRSYFERQLELLQPEYICCLGASAAHALLRTTRSVGQLRGRFHNYRGAKVLVTYHPSYLLRTPEMKKEAWEDMKLLLREMGQTPG